MVNARLGKGKWSFALCLNQYRGFEDTRKCFYLEKKCQSNNYMSCILPPYRPPTIFANTKHKPPASMVPICELACAMIWDTMFGPKLIGVHVIMHHKTTNSVSLTLLFSWQRNTNSAKIFNTAKSLGCTQRCRRGIRGPMSILIQAKLW